MRNAEAFRQSLQRPPVDAERPKHVPTRSLGTI